MAEHVVVVAVVDPGTTISGSWAAWKRIRANCPGKASRKISKSTCSERYRRARSILQIPILQTILLSH